MSYIPTEWKTGDVVTAEKLNKLENGVANAGGGAELPEYTADDIGKSLSVVATGSHTETATIIQEQTISLDTNTKANETKADSQNVPDPVAQLAPGTYDFSWIGSNPVNFVINGGTYETAVTDFTFPGTSISTSGFVLNLSNFEFSKGGTKGIVDNKLFIDEFGNVFKFGAFDGISSVTISATAEKVIQESGIAWAKSSGGVLIVHADVTTLPWTLDKTWQEIYDAGFSVLQVGEQFAWLLAIGVDGVIFYVDYFAYGEENPVEFVADSVDGYPATPEGS